MRPRRTPTTKSVFSLSGGTEDNDLFVEDAQDPDGNAVMVSVWEPDEAERRQLADGATIELLVWGRQHPPVAIAVGPSMAERKA